MSTCKPLSGLCVALLAFAGAATAPAAEGPSLGRTLTGAIPAGWDISIPPDGAGLPPGSGTAVAGEPIYAAKCQACHGADGEKGPNDRLVGGKGTLSSEQPVKTVGSYWPYATTLFDYIRRAMPFPQPHSLSDDEAYALTAYVLYLNGIVEREATMDAKTLPAVRMPNRNNFDWTADAPPPDDTSP